MLPRFYIEQTLTENTLVTLPMDVVKHICVLRLKTQQSVILFNGNGYAYQGTIHSIEKYHGVVHIMHQLPSDVHHVPIDLALCLINNNKMDIALQNSVELGVTSITPIMSKFSQRISQERLKTRIDHWMKVIISSCQQSGNNTLPILHAPITFIDAITTKYIGIKLIMLPQTNQQSSTQKTIINNLPIKVIIGPEGGFSTDEIEIAQNNGFNSINLGKFILRSETAVSASLSYINLTYGNWMNT